MKVALYIQERIMFSKTWKIGLALICQALVLLGFPLAGVRAQAQANKFSFEHLSVEDGLSQGAVFAIGQDDMGFIWLGTNDGLNRYDSKDFDVYRRIKNDSASLYSNNITCIFLDKQNGLWVGTAEGLNLYDRYHDRFIRIAVQGGNKSIQPQINSILEDHASNLWVGTGTGLYTCPISSKIQAGNRGTGMSFREIQQDSTGKNGIISSNVQVIYEGSKGDLWIGTDKGISKIHQQASGRLSFMAYQNKPGSYYPLSSGHVNDIAEFPKGTLWVGYFYGGLDKIDLAKRNVTNFSTKSPPLSRLSHNNIRKILINDDGKIWLGTRNGLNVLDPSSGTVSVNVHTVGNSGSLSDNSIHSMFKDNAGLIWLGTFYGGVNYYSPRTYNFTKYVPRPGQNSISHYVVSAIIEDPVTHNLFVGTEGGGLNYLERQNGHFTIFQKGNGTHDLQHDNIKCLYFDPDGYLWIGTSGGGLNIFDPKTFRFNETNDTEYINAQVTNWIYSIDGDAKGNTWLGTYGGGLYRYNRENHSIKHFTMGPDKLDLTSDQVRTVLVDSKQNIWVGTLSGLNKLNAPEDEMSHYWSIDSDTTSLGSNTIYTLYEDSKHRIWVGTSGWRPEFICS